MSWIDILILALAVAAVVGVVTATILRKKQGKTSCGCDCASCAGCSSCPSAKKTENKDA